MSITPSDAARLAAFLVHALRHPSPVNDPPLDADGWAEVPDVLRAAKTAGFMMSRFDFECAVREHGAQRLVLSQDRRRVRALGSLPEENGQRLDNPPSHMLRPAAATQQPDPAAERLATSS